MKKWIPIYIVVGMVMLFLSEFGSRAITVMAEREPIEWEHCVIIDAGHGGVDGGATSCAGILESSYNLDIARKLNDLLHFLGCRTKMIRTSDVSVYTTGNTISQQKISDLKERVRIVNETENAILVSIHQNHFSDSRYRGAQVFYANTGPSEQLAKKLQAQLVSELNPGSNRMCKQSRGIYLMDHIHTTAVLVECGFLSNIQEEALLRSKAYQQKLACVIGTTVHGFLSNA